MQAVTTGTAEILRKRINRSITYQKELLTRIDRGILEKMKLDDYFDKRFLFGMIQTTIE